MSQSMQGEGAPLEQLLRGLMRPVVAAAGAAVSAGASALWTVSALPVVARRKASSARARRGRA